MKQTALITGASSGIGYDLARLFAADGYDLVLVARTESKLRALAQQLEGEHGVSVRVLPFDLTDPAAPARIFEAAGPVNVLVNNAGFGTAGQFATETDARMELEMLQVNIVALTHLTKLFLPPMVARGAGQILNVASTAAFQPGPLMAVYYATKAYVLSFSEAIAEELSGSGVSVTALCPGPTATAFAETADMTDRRLFRLKKPMTSLQVARIGFEAMKRGRRVVVTGLSNKILAQSVRLSPRALTVKITKRLQEK